MPGPFSGPALRRSLACLVLAAAALVGGCAGGKPVGRVSGTVSCLGKPVTKGEVQFYLSDRGLGAAARIDESGGYTLDTPLEPGTYSVCVMPPTPEPTAPGARRGASVVAANIPKRYQQFGTSGLSCTVQPGRNEFPIEMKN